MSDNPYADLDSEALYAACAGDDPTARAEAYRALWPYLVRVAFRIVSDQPDAEAVAQDCAQRALVRIHQRHEECRNPGAFRTWSRRIVSHLAIDVLRARKRLLPLDTGSERDGHATQYEDPHPTPAEAVHEALGQRDLRHLLDMAPISERSQRVVVGRYLDDVPDEELAAAESDLAAQPVRPSHIQVTRSKNMAKLREWQPLRHYLSG